jgi:hypothetical protein
LAYGSVVSEISHVSDEFAGPGGSLLGRALGLTSGGEPPTDALLLTLRNLWVDQENIAHNLR